MIEARRTVIIGLGGTGKQTLHYMRRLFLDRYGAATLPHVAMVAIDTDSSKLKLDKTQYDEFDKEVAFDNELVVTPLDNPLSNIRANRALYPHISAWLDPALDKHGSLGEGAGQVRAYGRTAFFMHFDAIEKAISKAYADVCSDTAAKAARDQFGINVRQNSNISTWVIFSVAGGTGAGMFIDVSFLAQQISQSHGQGGVKPNAIILLPTAFSADLPRNISARDEYRIFANGYAALMELESYNYPHATTANGQPSNIFRAQWDKNSRSTVEFQGPVFENTWLVDNAPSGTAESGSGGNVNGDKMSLCHMMAEWLFVQSASSMADAMDTLHSNHADQIAAPARVTMGDAAATHAVDLLYSRNYSGFGLSKIYVPTGNLTNQAYARLVGDLAQLWLTDSAATTDVRASLEAALYTKLYLPQNGKVGGFTELLARRLATDGAGQSLNRRFDGLLTDKLAKLRMTQFKDGSASEARAWFNNEIMLKLLNASNDALAQLGEISAIIDPDTTNALIATIKAEIDGFLSATMRTPGARIGYARAALNLILGDFLQLQTQATAKAKAEQNRGQRVQRDADNLLNIAEMHHGFDRKEIYRATFDKMRERATAEIRRQAFLAAAKVAGEIAAHIGLGKKIKDQNGKEITVDTGLLSTITGLGRTLENLVERSDARIGALQRQPTSSINCRAPAVDTIVEVAEDGKPVKPRDNSELVNIYRAKGEPTGGGAATSKGAPIGRNELLAIEKRLYETLGKKGYVSPWYLRPKDDGRETNVEQAFADLLEFARGEFRYLTGQLEDALGHLARKYASENDDKLEAEINRVIVNGTPWLPSPSHAMGGDETYRNRSVDWIVASAGDAAPGLRRQLHEKLHFPIHNGVVGADKKHASVEGALDSVYVVGETPAVPLFSIRNIDLYRNAYLGYLESPDATHRVVHTDIDPEKFTDLLPFIQKEYLARQEAVTAFARAIALGVIERSPTVEASGMPGWMFKDSSPVHLIAPKYELGRYTTAIRRLSNPDRTLCNALGNEIGAREVNLTQDHLARLYYVIAVMADQPPVSGSEWQRAVASLMADLKARRPDIVELAKQARDSAETWIERVDSGTANPFLRVKGLVLAG
jgi:hypothetical protein